MARSWIKDATCLTRESGGWACARSTIEIVDGCIVALHAGSVEPHSDDRVIEASGLLAMPGLVNAHSHSPDNLLRGSAPQLPLELWSLHSAAGREARSPREAYVSAMLGAVEMLRTGTTALLDHVRISPDIDGESLDAIAQAYADVGIRAVIAPIVADRAVAETMPLEPADLDGLDLSAYGTRRPMPARKQMTVVADFMRRWHGEARARISVGIGPSAPQRCTDELLLMAAELAESREAVLHLHAVETRAQRLMGRKLYGRSTLTHLEALGVLGSRTSLAHAIWIEPDDLERIARSGTAIVHNPVSNARLGSGFCPLADYLDHGIRVGLGTDSACCNDSNNLLETTKWAGLLHNMVLPHARWIGADKALDLATRGSADAIGLGGDVGELAPGKRADITLVDLDVPGFTPLHDPVRQLVLAESGSSVVHVLVDGELVVHQRRVTRIDERSILAEAREIAARRAQSTAAIRAQAALLAAPIEAMYRRLASNEVAS